MPSTTSDAEESKGLYTEEELDSLGIEHSDPPNPLCEFCGKPLKVGAMIAIKSVIWLADGECDCEQSRLAKEAEERAQAAREARLRKEKYLSAGIGRRFLAATVSNHTGAEFLADFEKGQGTGLYIIGNAGSGKTYLASAIARQLIDAGKTVRMVTSTDMLAAIQQTFDNNESAFDAIYAYGRCGLLVIDDLGKESASDWSLATLFQIINMRYEAMLPTVVTSQYAFSKLIERFSRRGDEDTAVAIVSRLKETCTFINLGERNRRLEK